MEYIYIYHINIHYIGKAPLVVKVQTKTKARTAARGLFLSVQVCARSSKRSETLIGNELRETMKHAYLLAKRIFSQTRKGVCTRVCQANRMTNEFAMAEWGELLSVGIQRPWLSKLI